MKNLRKVLPATRQDIDDLITRLMRMETRMLVQTQDIVGRVEILAGAADAASAAIDRLIGLIGTATSPEDLAALQAAANEIGRVADVLGAAAAKANAAG